MPKALTGIGIINKRLRRHSLVTIYKSFVRPHYDDIIYDQPSNESFTVKIE